MKYNDSAIEILKNRHLPMSSSYAFETRYRLFKIMGEPDSALANYIRYKSFADSIDLNRKIISIERIDQRALLEAKKLNTKFLQEAIIREKRNNVILVIVAVILVLFVIVFLYLYFKLSKRKKQLTQNRIVLSRNLEEKTILLTELNHRVKNKLSLILSLMQIQKNSDKRDIGDWDQLESRITTMDMVHSLYSYSNENISGSTIDLEVYLKAIQDSYKEMSTRELEIITDITSIYVSIENALPIGMIFNELLSNSIKHAIVPEGKLIIEFKVTFNNDIFELDYKDNGTFFNGEAKESTGLFILKALTKQLEGTIMREKSHYKIILYKKFKYE